MSSASGLRQRKAAADDSPTGADGIAAAPAAAPAAAQPDEKKEHGILSALRAAAFAWRHSIAALGVFLLALFTRYYRLDKPPGVVFDEHHFGRFTNQYNAQNFFFDIHPPLGKLTLFAVSRLVDYDYTVCDYTHIDHAYDENCKFIFLRATSAFFGSLTAPIMYAIAVNFGAGVSGGLITALLFIFDGLNLTESRLVLIDAQVVFWCAVALLAGQCWWRRWNAHFEATGPADPRYMNYVTRILWCVICGIAYGNSVSVKFTGLASPGMVAVESFFAVFFLKRSIPLVDLLLVAFVVVNTFALYWYIHFSLLPNTADGDQFMSYEFQRSIINSTYYDPAAPKLPFWPTMFQHQIDMVISSNNIKERHNWESFWYEWPLNKRGLAYYSVDKSHTYTETVYLLGNPLVIWIVFGSLIASIVSAGLYLRFRSNPAYGCGKYSGFFATQAYCLIVYALNLLPYVGVARSSFVYHYMPALMYGEILTGLLLERLAGERWAPTLTKVLFAIIFATYLFFAPWVYALPLTNEGHARRRWLPRWN